MRIFLSPGYLRNLRRIVKKNHQKLTLITKKIQTFQNNRYDVSLKLHKLKGEQRESWSFSVEGNLRILVIFIDQNALLMNIGTHEEVY